MEGKREKDAVNKRGMMPQLSRPLQDFLGVATIKG